MPRYINKDGEVGPGCVVDYNMVRGLQMALRRTVKYTVLEKLLDADPIQTNKLSDLVRMVHDMPEELAAMRFRTYPDKRQYIIVARKVFFDYEGIPWDTVQDVMSGVMRDVHMPGQKKYPTRLDVRSRCFSERSRP